MNLFVCGFAKPLKIADIVFVLYNLFTDFYPFC